MPKKKDQRKVAVGLATGLSKNEAVRQAGYAESTARKKGFAIARRPAVLSLLSEALLELKDDVVSKAARCVNESLDAERVLVVPQGRFKPAQCERLPDHRVRLEGVDRVANLFGLTVSKATMPAPPRPPIAIHFHLRPAVPSTPQPTSIIDGKPAAPITMTARKPFRFTFTTTGKHNEKGDEHHG